MRTLAIRHVEDEVHERLRRRVADHGPSVEADVRQILVDAPGAPTKNLLVSVRELVGTAVRTSIPLASRAGELLREADFG